MSSRDRIYASPRPHLVDFAFDEAVADVFPDMIRRSVPGYETIISLLGVVGASHHVPGTRVVDLGCSLGAATLSLYHQIGAGDVNYVAVDNSPAMLDRCRATLGRHMADAEIDFIHGDIRDVDIGDASVVVLNFTLQFIPPADRKAVLAGVYRGLRPGGVLILSEKIHGETAEDDERLIALHHRFKAANGYSDMEISQKRSALENVMQLDTLTRHVERLESVGFTTVRPWFQCLNFVSMAALR